jgi:NAD(P)-dependent dehydrogenase (short-subunit alcohol dehydrogenase family)
MLKRALRRSNGMPSLEGRVAWVTGGGSGIGRASALALAAQGAVVTVGDIDPKAAEFTAAEIVRRGGQARALACDVTRAEDMQAAIRDILEAYGRLDIAHNNAGWEGPVAKLADVEEKDFDRVLAVNLKGVFLGLKFEIPAMVQGGGGSIVNTASVAGLVAHQGASPYSAAKHGVVGLTKTAASEYARKGVRVNAICPGWTQTPMLERMASSYPRVVEGYLSKNPSGRLGSADEVANLVVFLASDAARYVNGAALAIDGGWTAV